MVVSPCINQMSETMTTRNEVMTKTVDVSHADGWQHLQILLNQGWKLKYTGLNLVIYLLEKERISQ